MYTPDFLSQITSLGIVRYSLDKIVNIIDVDDITQFEKDFNNPQSDVAKAYQKGIDRSDYDIDIRLFEMAKSGDLKALEKYEQRIWTRQKQKPKKKSL
jgi:hypothetical protein